jgi:hypothetical protein
VPEDHTLEMPVVIPGDPGGKEMPAAAEENNMQVVLSGMASESAAAQARRTSRMDHLSADSASMWTVAMTSPTVMAAMGFRVAQQSGGWPAASGTGTGQ